jgi:hypothetical protein
LRAHTGLVKRRGGTPDSALLVTAARSSRGRIIDERQRKYLLTMSLRSLSFVVAVVLYLVHLKWVAAGVLGLSLLAPIFAVVAANNHIRPNEGSADFYANEADPNQTRIEPGRTIDL